MLIFLDNIHQKGHQVRAYTILSKNYVMLLTSVRWFSRWSSQRFEFDCVASHNKFISKTLRKLVCRLSSTIIVNSVIFCYVLPCFRVLAVWLLQKQLNYLQHQYVFYTIYSDFLFKNLHKIRVDLFETASTACLQWFRALEVKFVINVFGKHNKYSFLSTTMSTHLIVLI